jgi:hypothetical protein
VVLHDRGATDSAEQALLHSALEADDRYLRRWLAARQDNVRKKINGAHQLYLNFYLAHTYPRKRDTGLR